MNFRFYGLIQWKMHPAVRRLTVFPVLLLSLIFSNSSAQVFSRHYSTEQGLPSSEVYDVYQDPQGFMWFATDRGICRYDGYSFVTYTKRDGLPDNVVFRFFDDQQGRLWFHTLSGAIGCYEYSTGRFRGHPANARIKETCKFTLLSSFYIDSAQRVWFTISINAFSIFVVDTAGHQYEVKHDSTITGNAGIFLKKTPGAVVLTGNLPKYRNASTRGTVKQHLNTNLYVTLPKPLTDWQRIACIKLNNGSYASAIESTLHIFNDSVFMESRQRT